MHYVQTNPPPRIELNDFFIQRKVRHFQNRLPDYGLVDHCKNSLGLAIATPEMLKALVCKHDPQELRSIGHHMNSMNQGMHFDFVTATAIISEPYMFKWVLSRIKVNPVYPIVLFCAGTKISTPTGIAIPYFHYVINQSHVNYGIVPLWYGKRTPNQFFLMYGD